MNKKLDSEHEIVVLDDGAIKIFRVFGFSCRTFLRGFGLDYPNIRGAGNEIHEARY